MMPGNTVSNISHERLFNKVGTQALYRPDAPMNHNADAEHSPMVPQAGDVRSRDDLLTPNKVKAMRNANTESQLKSNFWFEISRIALWSTTGLIALTLMTFTALPGTALAALPLFVPLIGVAAAATVLIKSSQYSKRIVTERWFDVQDFQMQRQAALIGKSFETATAKQQNDNASEEWLQRVSAKKLNSTLER